MLIVALLEVIGCFSRYAAPGTDTVISDAPDTYEIIGHVKKPNARHIKYAKYTTPISDDLYPYPGHVATQDVLNLVAIEETNIQKNFLRNDMTSNMQFYHPVGVKQFNGNETAVALANRTVVRHIINNWYNDRHKSPFYAPPGELITITFVSEDAANKLTLVINEQTRDPLINPPSFRLSKMKFVIKLTKRVNKIITPIGGGLTFMGTNGFAPPGKCPIEMIVSGCIMAPFFVYGVTSDEEFNEQIATTASPLASFDYGNLQGIGWVSDIRNIYPIRANDVGRLFRTRVELANQIAPDRLGNPQYGRHIRPINLYADSLVEVGWAYAYEYFCMFHTEVSSNMLSYITQANWGIYHEVNHHRQRGWGVGSTAEVTNNVINLILYSRLFNPPRYDHGNGSCSHMSGSGIQNSFLYFQIELKFTQSDLAFWGVMLHYFGVEKFVKLIDTDKKNQLYSKQQWGVEYSELLRATKIFGMNMTDHFYFGDIIKEDSVPVLPENVAKEIENIKKETPTFQQFHPVSNFYANGVRKNEEDIVTNLPFDIPIDSDYTFEFNKYEKSRSSFGEEKWGKFVLEGIETIPGNTSGTFTNTTTHTYTYTPDPTKPVFFVDTFYLKYRDTTMPKNDEKSITRLIVQLRYLFGFCNRRFFDDFKKNDVEKYSNSFEAYTASLSMQPNVSIPVNSLQIGNTNTRKTFLEIRQGKLKVPRSGNYTFYLKADDKGLFFLTNNPQSQMNQQNEELLIQRDTYTGGWSEKSKSKSIELDSETIYYFTLVCYNTEGKGSATIGYKYGLETTIQNVPDGWIYNTGVTAEDKYNLEYKPEWIEIHDINKWKGNRDFWIDRSKFKFYKFPAPQNDGSTPDVAFDGSEKTSFITAWSSRPQPEFPHVFEFDMQEIHTFSHLKFVSDTKYKVNGTIEVRVSETNETLDDESKIVLTGECSSLSQDFNLLTDASGRYVRLTIFNNSFLWRNKITGTSISEISIGHTWDPSVKFLIPATSTKINYTGVLSRRLNSPYPNGHSFKGYEGSNIRCKFPVGTKQFVVIGDKSDTMGDFTVTIDGQAENGRKLRKLSDYERDNLKYTTVAHRGILYVSKILDTSMTHTFKMTVTSGKVVFGGFISNVESVMTDEDALKDKVTETPNDDEPVYTNPPDTGDEGGETPVPATKEPEDENVVDVLITNRITQSIDKTAIIGIIVGAVICLIIFVVSIALILRFRKEYQELSNVGQEITI